MLTTNDILILLVAIIQEYGIMDNLVIKGKFIKEAHDLIENRGQGKVSLVTTLDGDGDGLNITCLFTDHQREEWKRLRMVGENEIST